MREFFLFVALLFILVLSLWAIEAKETVFLHDARIETLECQVNRILHPGLVDECGGRE